MLENSLFFYPAVKQPAVDFMLCPKGSHDLSYRFFHGFGFSGSFRFVMSLDGDDGPFSLPDLVRAGFHVSSADSIGLVVLGESKGLWGMHLRCVPTVENRPKNGKRPAMGSLSFSSSFQIASGPFLLGDTFSTPASRR